MIGKEELEAVTRVIKSGQLSGYTGNWSDSFYGGTEIRALEKEWAEYFGVKHAIAVNSNSSGLWCACGAVLGTPTPRHMQSKNGGLNSSDEVCLMLGECICTPYSMTISASVPLHFGAKPVFADIEPDYFCLDPRSIEEKITERTKAIIVVDLFGQPYDADAINAIAKKHNLIVIEDAAQAPGAKYKGRYAGTLGDIGVFSLNFHKHIQCGEGGMVVTDNDELAFKIRLLMNHSEAVINDMSKIIDHAPDFRDMNMYHDNIGLVGMNLRMTELQAAVAREQLKKLDGIVKKYQEYAEHFPVKVRPDCEHSFYRYAFTGVDVTDELWNDSIVNFKRGYITPLYKMPLFKHLGYANNLCPTCEDVEKNIVLAWLKEAA